jgi:hypothetical protein
LGRAPTRVNFLAVRAVIRARTNFPFLGISGVTVAVGLPVIVRILLFPLSLRIANAIGIRLSPSSLLLAMKLKLPRLIFRAHLSKRGCNLSRHLALVRDSFGQFPPSNARSVVGAPIFL